MTQADYVAARIEALGFDWTVPYWLEEVFLVPNNLTKVVYALSITDAGENTNYSPVLKLVCLCLTCLPSARFQRIFIFLNVQKKDYCLSTKTRSTSVWGHSLTTPVLVMECRKTNIT